MQRGVRDISLPYSFIIMSLFRDRPRPDYNGFAYGFRTLQFASMALGCRDIVLHTAFFV